MLGRPVDDLKQRMRAARELAGIRSDLALSLKVDERGLGYGTVRAIQKGTRPVYRSELLRIAEVCDVPVAWFYVDDLSDELRRRLRMPDDAAEIEQELGDAHPQDDSQPDDNEEDGRAQGDSA